MSDKRFTLLDAASVIVATVLAGLAIWCATQAPDVAYPMQFGLDGQVNRWGSRYELAGLFAVLAGVSVLVAGPMGWHRRKAADPARARSLKFGQLVALLTTAGVGAIATVTLLNHGAVDANLSPRLALGGAGLLFIVIGAWLGRVGPNPLVGVRTPWSYKSRLAWDRSNRLAGRLFFWGGLLIILTAILAPALTGFVIGGVVIVSLVWSVFESWRVWRSDPDRQPF